MPATDDVETRQRGIMDDTIDEEGDNMPSTQEDVAQVRYFLIHQIYIAGLFVMP